MEARDNEEYWIARHEQLRSKLAAVGDISSSEEDNLERYAKKKRSVATLLRAMDRIDLTGSSVLDAGCGVGMLSELLYVLGADVSGVDASPIAVAEARHRCPDGDFQTASLLDFSFEAKFDLTFCVDVLYHVVGDANWKEVLRNLVAHTSPGGSVVILDQHKHEPTSPADHVKFRTRAMYDETMAEAGVVPRAMPGQAMFLVYGT